jgi:hypothetical protein
MSKMTSKNINKNMMKGAMYIGAYTPEDAPTHIKRNMYVKVV